MKNNREKFILFASVTLFTLLSLANLSIHFGSATYRYDATYNPVLAMDVLLLIILGLVLVLGFSAFKDKSHLSLKTASPNPYQKQAWWRIMDAYLKVATNQRKFITGYQSNSADTLQSFPSVRKGRVSREIPLYQKEDYVCMDLLVQEVILALTEKFLHKNIHLDLEMRASFVVLGNEAMIRTAILNILENAIEYCPDGGNIQISVRNKGIIRISDNGIGIARKHRRRIFDPFYTIKQKDTKQTDGMGLAISREIIQEHGGTITCLDTLDRIGSLFEINFKLPF